MPRIGLLFSEPSMVCARNIYKLKLPIKAPKKQTMPEAVPIQINLGDLLANVAANPNILEDFRAALAHGTEPLESLLIKINMLQSYIAPELYRVMMRELLEAARAQGLM